ncbi:UDPglucose glycoprotein glucose phosphotransferase, partial [Scheffersomyces coipomensis]|uniref:UDPglucose glycoprotein glucose phosphotransferase n=1 Tax=Scheffersomyces coipomensis TaxID=1788519 RepID=UPI00315CC767
MIVSYVSLIFSYCLLLARGADFIHDPSNDIDINLVATWSTTDFKLNLLESISSHNHSLYLQAVLHIFDINNEDSEDSPIESNSEQSKYTDIITKVNIEEESKGFIDFDLIYKMYSPRIQTHYKHYKNEVEPIYSKRLIEECTTDSFGNQILTDKKKKHDAWVVYNKQLYCSKDDLYALKTDKSSDADILPFDRVIGENNKAPLLVFYGDHESNQFREFFENLYESAKSGKIRFVWRYVPSHTGKLEELNGYGVDLTVKRTDYEESRSKSSNLDITSDFLKIQTSQELKPVNNEELEDLGVQLTYFILNNQYNNISQYDFLTQLLEEFPRYAHYVSKLPKTEIYKKAREQMHHNEDVGLSTSSYDLYVNGSPINKLDLDIFKLYEKIKKELKLINHLQSLGFSVEQAKLLLTKFALITSVKQTQFRSGNSVMGNNENRFKLYEDVYDKSNGVVVFLNDIEKDDGYQQYSTDRKDVYLGPNSFMLRSNQIPPLRENVHDLIFAVNLANKEQLRVMFTLSKIILDNGIPQQVGILPVIGEDPKDLELAERFYFLVKSTSVQEALALLYKYFEAPASDDVETLLRSVPVPDDFNFDLEKFQSTLRKYSIDTASVIFNGVIYELTSPNWQIAMGQQLSQDIALLKRYIEDDRTKGKSLKSLLYQNAKSERNLRIIPTEPGDIIYKSIDEDLISKSIRFRKQDRSRDITGSFWLIGDFNKLSTIKQLINIFEVFKKSEYDTHIRIYNTGTRVKLIDSIIKSFKLSSLSTGDINKIIEKLSKVKDSKSSPDQESITLLESKHLPSNHEYLLLNGRYFRLDIPLSNKDLELMLEYEFSQRLEIFNDIVNAYPEKFRYKKILEFNILEKKLETHDWFDVLSVLVTKSFHVDDKLYVSDVNRFDFSKLDLGNAIEVFPYNSQKKIDLFLIINPIDEFAQKAISIINSFKDFPFVNTRILLQPRVESVDGAKINRFYKGAFPSTKLEFDANGRFSSSNGVKVKNMPGSTVFTTDIDAPSSWVTTIKGSPIGVDLDNVMFNNYEIKSIYGTYQLKHILVEGFARDVTNGKPPAGVSIELTNGFISTDTSVMSNLGYFQLQANPGVWKFQIKTGKSKKHYSLLSSTENKFSANTIPNDFDELAILTVRGLQVYPRLKKKDDFKEVSFLNDVEDEDVAENTKSAGLMNSWFTKKDSKEPSQADINVFSIASGHLYERLISIMMASVRKNTTKSVKFWIIENFVSSHFKVLLPILAETYDFEYELITYRWPNFLRKQREKQRTIWGYKILFLDVLFPQDLKKVIFVDADQIARTDLFNLVNVDLEGAPYGFTPIGESRDEMEGFRFWKQGYWQNVLKEDLKYHISALYVVDLVKFRQITAGDRLRSHYQKLSSDPNSLSNLDQDLPNNMQRQIKIFSLPQEWLWCETWNSDSLLADAKMIDLCNNPLTKENKLDVARRLIPEWSVYDEEIGLLIDQAQDIEQQQQQQQEEQVQEQIQDENEEDEHHLDDEDE